MSEFVAEIKKVTIESGKEVAKVDMLIPKAMAPKLELGNVKVVVKSSQEKLPGTDTEEE